MASRANPNSRNSKSPSRLAAQSQEQQTNHLTNVRELVELIRDACKAAAASEPCAITSRARALNSPYDFEEVTSLNPGREGHGSPLLIASLDREAGIKQIRENFLARKDEHSWIYVPRADLWIDDTTEIEEHGVSSDPFLRTVLLRTYPEIEVFHTHPDALYRALSKEGRLPATCLIIAATPSQGDQFGAAMLEDFAGPRTKLKSHVISHFGVTSYRRTDEFRTNDDLIAKPFVWDFADINAKSPPSEEITRICESLEKKVAAVKANDTRIPTWEISFMPFKG